MIGTDESNTPATIADVRKIVREEIARWWAGVNDELRRRIEEADEED